MLVIDEWLSFNRLYMNWSKTHAINFIKNESYRIECEDIKVNNYAIKFESNTKILGVIVDEFLDFDLHTNFIISKVNSKLYILTRSLYLFPSFFKATLFKLFIYSHFEYCSTLFFINKNFKKLNKTYTKAIFRFFKIKLDISNLEHQYSQLKHLNILPLCLRLFNHFCLFIHNILSSQKESQLSLHINKHKIKNNMSLRKKFRHLQYISNYAKNSFVNISIKLLNNFIYNNLHLSKPEFKQYLENNNYLLYKDNSQFLNLDIGFG